MNQHNLESIRCFIRETEKQLQQCNDVTLREQLEAQLQIAYQDFEKSHALSIVSKAVSTQGRLSMLPETGEYVGEGLVNVGHWQTPRKRDFEDFVLDPRFDHSNTVSSIPVESLDRSQGNYYLVPDSSFAFSMNSSVAAGPSLPSVNDSDAKTLQEDNPNIYVLKNGNRATEPSLIRKYKLLFSLILLLAMIGLAMGLYFAMSKPFNSNSTSSNNEESGNQVLVTLTSTSGTAIVTVTTVAPSSAPRAGNSNPNQPPNQPIQQPVQPSQPNPPVLVSNGCVSNWRYQTPNGEIKGPYDQCTLEGSSRAWCMLPSYVSGGQENLNWKYTTDLNDGACLTNWNYYDSKHVLILGNIPRTTTQGDTRSWCGLRVYRTGGQENMDWKYC